MPTSPITEKAVGPPPPSRVPPPPPPNAAIPRLIASPAAKLDGPATAAVLSPERFTDAARAEAAETLAAHRPGPKVLTKDGKRKRAVLTKKANRRPGVPVEGTEKKPTVPTEGADKKPAGAKTQKKAGVKDFWRIFSYSTGLDRLILLVAFIAALGAGATMPMMALVFGRMIGSFTDYYKLGAAAPTHSFRESFNECSLYLTYIFIAKLGLSFIGSLGFRMTSLRISAAVRLEYLRCLFSQPISTLDVLPPGQTAAIITITASTLQAGISEKLAQLIQSISLVITALAISFTYSWNLALVTGSGLVLIVIVFGITIPLVVKSMASVQQADIQASVVANETFNAIRMVAACGAESKMEKRYAGWVDEARRRGRTMPPLIAFQQAPVFFSVYATFALSFWYSLKMYREQKINSPETLIVVLMSVMLMTSSIRGVTAPISAASRAAGASAIFHTVINAPKPKSGGLKDPDVSATGDIDLNNVNFAYPSRPGIKILNSLSLRFQAGKITALVGPSGSGKSTIVGLIERWYELDKGPMGYATRIRNGTIKIGGQHLKDIDLKWWRSQIGLVQQEPFLFNTTIYENVEYGLIGTQWEKASPNIRKEMVKKACEEAFVDEFVDRLPQGYDTVVGDAGLKLSGGQRQRVAIARSIVKQPKILILDEATSSIDVRSEQVVQAALDKVSKGRTTITIAHRLSTVMKADCIMVLRKGQVIQLGTHKTLMARGNGLYYNLATAQQLAAAPKSIEDVPSFSDLSEKKSMQFTDSEESASGDSTDTTTSAPRKAVVQQKPRGLIGSFGLLLREQKGHWPWYILLLLGAVGGGATAPLHAYLFAHLISLFRYWGEYLIQQTNFWCLMFAMLAVMVGLSYFAMAWSATILSMRITRTYREEYFHNFLAKSVAFFDSEENSVGALTARLATDPAQLQQMLGMNMASVIISLFSIVGCLALAFYFGWKLTAVALASSMPLIIAAAFFRVRYEAKFEQMNNKVFSESAKFATESIGASRTVASLTLEDTICNRYQSLLKTHIWKAFPKASLSTFLFAVSDSIPLLCMAFVLWYGGGLMLSGEYDPFHYIVVYVAVMQGGLNAGQWLSYGPNIAKAAVAAGRIIDMRAKDLSDGRLISLDFGNIGDNDKGVKIHLQNVWFKYPTRDAAILNGLDLTIEKGQFAAIVGPSGSGKTTVISLLERFYKPKVGRISYNGSDVSYLSLNHYRREISLVAQEPGLLNGSIRENILLGVDETLTTDEDVHQACRDAGIHDFIISLPDGYNTQVGSRGVALSGGQKQRLSIARALIRSPRLLLLDEATSNLDAETEKAVQAVLEKNKKNRTMVVVAHRLATIQNADVIFVLGDGKVVEKGNHASLLQKKGVYYQMCQAQALDR